MKAKETALCAICIVSAAVLLLLFAAACTGKEKPREINTGQENETQKQVYSGPAWPVLALLETGENPLWFELRPEGPGLIDSPAAASLTPYIPWPYARFVSGILVWDDFLVMAVNRDGFLILGPSAWSGPQGASSGAADTGVTSGPLYQDVGLYRASSGGFWDPYTAESFFLWNDKPAVLLYRNDFFAEPDAPSPRPQVYVLDKSSPVPLGAAVPALERFPSDGPWEAEVVQRGTDGFWYYRMKEKGKPQNETAYFRAQDLEGEGTKISAGQWRDSELPLGPENAPPLLALVAENAAAELGQALVVRAVSPDFEGPRLFSSGAPSTGSENLTLLYGYCRGNTHDDSEALALAILPDGRGFYSRGTAEKVQTFSLPALGEGFVYTGAALLGDVLAASWEEQQEAGIGAAGFMVMKFAVK